jgi:N6-L-threonylcarbamoyladenine synthase
MRDRDLIILGIETSCDETAAAVVRGRPPGPGHILSNVIFSQVQAHAPYGGVVPEIASRAHLEIVDGVIRQALATANITLADVDGIAATAGPGLIGGVMVGLTTAKGLALAADKPLLAVNHLKGHALSARLTQGVPFPFLLLLVSGGHCQLLGVGEPDECGEDDFRLYGTTIDDAVGEAFDKAAKILGLPYPGGPAVEQAARSGNARAVALPRPLVTGHNARPGADFSFSGLKTALRLWAQRQDGELTQQAVADACASFQGAVIDILRDRTKAAMSMFMYDFPNAAKKALVVAGGVAANQAIGAALKDLTAAHGFELHVPAPSLCTDNGAMIAWAGLEMLIAKEGAAGLEMPSDALAVAPRARWPLHGQRPG